MIEQGSAPEEQGIGMIETGKCHAPPVTSSIRAHRWRLVLQREQPEVGKAGVSANMALALEDTGCAELVGRLHDALADAVHRGHDLEWRPTAPRRCCTNPHWPARCQPTGFSPADAIRHWSAEGGHPIEDFAAVDHLTPLPGWAPGAKAISDDGFVSEERILHPALTMVP